jgi:NAD(P)-dependent dehydrogenase (short-subunit alcohol dehydrogenase family)
MVKDLNGKVAFVTGGASGIGLAMAKAFLARGMRVAIADVSPERLSQAVVELGQPADVHAITVDVSDRASLERAADETERAFGKVHVLCNNAGIACAGPGHTAPPEQWQRVLDVNLNGTFHGVQVFVPRIKRHGEGGHIVNTASMTGLYPNRNQFVYGSSKYAIVGLSEFLRDDLAREDISVSVLCPDAVLTPISAFRPRPGDTDEIRAQRAAYLARHGIELVMPDAVGEMVVRGILADELYIFTDGRRSRELVRQRMHNILTAFDRQFPSSDPRASS